jgi:hypothetical protein
MNIQDSSTKHGENEEVDNSGTPSQGKQIKENSRARRQRKRLEKQGKGSLTKHGENEEVDNPETPSQVFFLNSSKCKQVLCYSSAET